MPGLKPGIDALRRMAEPAGSAMGQSAGEGRAGRPGTPYPCRQSMSELWPCGKHRLTVRRRHEADIRHVRRLAGTPPVVVFTLLEVFFRII